MKEKYVCNDCKGVDPCPLSFNKELVRPPTHCPFDGQQCNWKKEKVEEEASLLKMFGD